MSDTRKQAIINALRAFVNQRPGFELGNYSTMADYRSDSRRATRQRDEALQLLRDIELRDSITAEAILEEAQSGRVQIRGGSVACGCGWTEQGRTTGQTTCPKCQRQDVQFNPYSIDYCTGQYFCTEFRGAVARLCASVLWTWKREQCMPSGPNRERLSNGDTTYWLDTAPTPDNSFGGKPGNFVSGGDWLRASFRREYGRTLSARYFD